MGLKEEGDKMINSLTKTYFMQRYTAMLTLHTYRTNAFPPIIISILTALPAVTHSQIEKATFYLKS